MLISLLKLKLKKPNIVKTLIKNFNFKIVFYIKIHLPFLCLNPEGCKREMDFLKDISDEGK